MKHLSKGFWKTIGICLAILVFAVVVLCIIQAIRMSGSGMSYGDMWRNWTPFFPKKPVSDGVVATMFRI